MPARTLSRTLGRLAPNERGPDFECTVSLEAQAEYSTSAAEGGVCVTPAGWFGKLSFRGDFVTRRLPDSWVSRVDDWLGSAMENSRHELGGRWMDAYLNAAAVRWAFAPGVMDSAWWFGVLMPSCDSVGRYFPLVVAQACEVAPSSDDSFKRLDAWWNYIAEAMLETLSDQSSLESFETRLGRAPGLDFASQEDRQHLYPLGNGRWRVTPKAQLGQLLPELAAAEWRGRLSNCTLWWPMAAEGDESQLIVVQGLPSHGLLSRLILLEQ